MDRREYHRAQLRLPVRLRWTTPFGQKTEVCETLDASRGGLLVPCREAHAPGVPLWVTFPYDTSLNDGQPEVLATVVRTAGDSNGYTGNGKDFAPDAQKTGTNGSRSAKLGLHFEIAAHPRGNGRTRERERRAGSRRPLAIPIRVRPGSIPWFEEAMTIDVSAEGLRFISNREYQVGEHLLVSFDGAAAVPWPGAKEFASRVVRVDALPQSPTLAVSVRRLP